MGPRFDDVIPFFGNTVLAIGPLHGPPPAGDYILEVCAWVFQASPDHSEDAAATEMTTNREPGGGRFTFRQTKGSRWMLPLSRLGDSEDFREGRAFAVAVAYVVDLSDDPSGAKPRVVWWGQPVDLKIDAERINAAADAAPDVLDTDPLLSVPIDATDGSPTSR